MLGVHNGASSRYTRGSLSLTSPLHSHNFHHKPHYHWRPSQQYSHPLLGISTSVMPGTLRDV
ncbi:hypothetical protein P691DRAFT_599349 [Macrolepiota fuliginosa MF-IS2]|uniref:Uncharacterized protein n=1 Tax=Macrolepiota fuliginosa MF-IS2 TaxID=1400762 RepID=A0A9P6BX66_9AGAR|nr:hypothetical protein P691DRAFT_599349 [Macrolepiota fuliginosa MF-IS2]